MRFPIVTDVCINKRSLYERRVHHHALAYLSEFPFTVGVPHRNTPDLLDVLVRDGGEEAVEEAGGEVAGRLLKRNSQKFREYAFTVTGYFDQLVG